MNTVKISGHSDDLIEVEGNVPGCNEYGFYADKPGYIEFSTGDVFSAQYTDRGTWRVEHHVNTGVLDVGIERCPEGDEPDPYTDVATIAGPISSVDFWKSWPPSIDNVREKVERVTEDMDAIQCKKVFAALFGHRKWLQSI